MAGSAATIIGNIARFIIHATTAIWLVLIAFAQMTCSIVPWLGTHCHDERIDIWMLPFFTAAIGIPALINSIIFLRAQIRGRRAF